nr:putative ribonuclease H-like domain-containing protein [Tanacetum cinerariifolium]
MILNTLDNLGKFKPKGDEGYFLGYLMSSKAIRVFNKRTKRVEENVHIEFLENKAIEKGSGPSWLFNIDSLTKFMNYVPVVDAGTNSTNFSGTKVDARKDVKKDVSSLRYIVLPNSVHEEHLESISSKPQDPCNTDAPESSGNSNPIATLTNPSGYQVETLTVETPIPTVSSSVPTVCFTDSQEPSSETRLISKMVTNQAETPSLDNILTLTNQFEDTLRVTTNSKESNGVEADVSNMEASITASPTPTLRIHKDHPKSQIIDPSWVESMQDELLQFKIQNVWTLVDCPKGVRPIGTKWVLKNKKYERGIVIRNKARLVAQGYTQEEEIDYDEVFASVTRIEAIRLLLAYAFLMDFVVYQMDVKSTFLYGTIDEEVYVMQPPVFQDPDFPSKVYKVKKAMYGLHQAPRAWYGYTQEERIDYEEVFAPVARIETIRLFLAYASFMGFVVYQMDVKSVFLYGTIDEEVYVMQPLGFQDPEFPDRVYKVEKAMYGLHQAPRSCSPFQQGETLELANTPLNENCSAVILKKLPEKLGDPVKFLIPCGFSELKCKALADLVKNDVFDPEGGNVLLEKLLDLDSTKYLPPPHNINPLSGSTTFSSPDHLLKEFADELALITFPLGNDDLSFDIESNLREIEYLLNHHPIKEMDSILEDSVDECNLANPNDNLFDTIPEMFTEEHALDYSSSPLNDDYDDDLVDLESDNEYVYDDPFKSKEDKIKESKLLIDELDPFRSSDFLPFPEYDSFLFEDFFKIDALPLTNNEDKVFNPGILIHENPSEVTVQVTPDKNAKKISHASLNLEDFDPPLYELPFHKEVPWSETLLSFSSKNKEKVFKPGILTSKGVLSSLIPKLSHRGPKAFKVIKILKSPMEIFPCSYGEDIRILDVSYLHLYPP